MPNQPKTPLKCFRIPEANYAAAKRYAELQGTTLSEVIRNFVQSYVDSAPPSVRGHSCQHKAYRMTCAEFDALVDEADGKCQRCDAEDSPMVIDHDHRFGLGAVRGLLCRSCNSAMIRVDSGEAGELDIQTARYLARSWHLRKAVAP